MKKRSPIWKVSPEQFQSVIAESHTYTEALAHFALKNIGGNHKTLKRRIQEEGVDTSHFKMIGQRNKDRAKPLAELLVKGSTYNKYRLKKRLIKEGLLKETCAKCQRGPSWEGQSLALEMDHINGDPLDDRIDNLRLLCPNCHSQTSTFRGRKNKKSHYCALCAVKVSHNAKLCHGCSTAATGLKNRKIKVRPSPEQLLADIDKLGYVGTGKKYGVSDNAIRKWLR